jgi:hypothetical protein
VNNEQALGTLTSNYNILKNSTDEGVKGNLGKYLSFEAKRWGMTEAQLRTFLDSRTTGE